MERDHFFHSLVFLFEPNQVFLAVAILLLLIGGGGKQEGLAEFNQKLHWWKGTGEQAQPDLLFPDTEKTAVRCLRLLPACFACCWSWLLLV